MHPILKKVLIYGTVIIILAVLSAVVIAYLNEDRIRNLVVNQINDVLETEASVESIEFSLLQTFPKASIRFNHFRIKERTTGRDTNDLIDADMVFLKFDPLDLLTGTYVIDEILVKDGKVRLSIFKDGSGNYEIFRSDSTNQAFQLSLKKVTLKNTVLEFENFKRGERFTTALSEMNLRGEFGESVYDLEATATGEMQRFEFQALQLPHSYPMNLNVLMKVNSDQNRYVFQKAKTKLGNLDFQMTGTYVHGDESQIELGFRGEKNQLADVKELLSEKNRETLEAYQIKGLLDIDGKISGKISHHKSPDIAIGFVLQNGSLVHEKSGVAWDDIYMQGNYSNGPYHNVRSSSVNVDSIRVSGNAGVGHGHFVLTDLENPLFESQLFYEIDLSELHGMIRNDSLESLSGNAIISVDVKMLVDSLSKLSKTNLKTADMSGEAQLTDVAFRWKGMSDELSSLNGHLTFGRNLVELDSLTGNSGKTAFRVGGKIYNLLPFLFFDDEILKVAANMYVPQLSLDPFFTSNESQPAETGLLYERIEAQIDLKSDDVSFHKFKAHDLQLELKVKHPLLIIQNVTFGAAQGLVTGWLQMETESMHSHAIKTELTLEGIDIHELFEQCENFGQTAIKAENLKGKANVGIAFNGRLNPDYSVIKESIYTSAKLDILNGELINYQPALALSKYIDVEELKHIRFSRLVNEIEIINQVVYLPEMEVKSSALELKLSGKHSFNNELEYHFQLWLNDFLFRKAKRSKKNQTEFGEVETDESGRAKLFIRMEGTIDDYSIKLDRKAMRKVWNDNMKEERNELKDLFREEFKGEKREQKAAPKNFSIEWEGLQSESGSESGSGSESESGSGSVESGRQEDKKTGRQEDKNTREQEDKKKKWFEKAGEPIKDEYETYDPNKLD